MMVQISTIEENKNTLSKIRRLCLNLDNIAWTGRALEDIALTDGLTQKGVLQAIIGHIDASGKVTRGLTKYVEKYVGMTIFEMLIEIEGTVRYIKVQLQEKEGQECLVVISAHDST
jgi:hypothetical protein